MKVCWSGWVTSKSAFVVILRVRGIEVLVVEAKKVLLHTPTYRVG